MMPSGSDQVCGSAAEDRLPPPATTGDPKVCSTTSTCTWWYRHRYLFGIPAIAETLDTIAADYGITVQTNAEVTSVDAVDTQGGL